MFYGLRVRTAMLNRPVIKLFGPATAHALGRAVSHAGSDWKMLLLRLKGNGLSPRDAAIVTTAWFAANAKPDRLGFDLSRPMAYSSEVLLNSLFEAQLWHRYFAVRKIMEAEGLSDEVEAEDVVAS